MAYYAELNVYLDSSGAGSSNNRPKKVKQPKEKKVNSLKATAITAIALRSAVQTANFVNTKVGDYTGNKVMQSNISTALSVGSQLVGATLAGAKLGGGVMDPTPAKTYSIQKQYYVYRSLASFAANTDVYVKAIV